MRDRFDQRQERQLGPKPGRDDVVEPRLADVTVLGRRREWSASERARVIVESLTPGANVSEVARRNGLSPQRLHGWRRETRELFADSGDRGEARAASATSTVQPSSSHDVAMSKTRSPILVPPSFVPPSFVPPTFVPIVVAAGASGSTPPPDETDTDKHAMQAGAIEIAIGQCVVRVTGRVDANTLAAVIETVRRLACS